MRLAALAFGVLVFAASCSGGAKQANSLATTVPGSSTTSSLLTTTTGRPLGTTTTTAAAPTTTATTVFRSKITVPHISAPNITVAPFRPPAVSLPRP